MGVSDYLINALSSVIAISYIEACFPRKYSGRKAGLCFLAGCVVYFVVLNGINTLFFQEGMLGLIYGCVIAGYGAVALRAGALELILAGILWVLILALSAFGLFCLLALVGGGTLADVLGTDGWLWICVALATAVFRMIMGRIVAVCFERRRRSCRAEDLAVAAILFFMLAISNGIFWLEIYEGSDQMRTMLLIGMFTGEFLMVFAVEQIYRRLGRYQRERMERQYWQEREADRTEDLEHFYRMVREVNHWRHDMSGELEVVRRLLQGGKSEEAGVCIDTLLGGIAHLPELPKETGSEGLDAALMRAIPRCQEENIRFRYLVLGDPSGISPLELGNLVNNLLANGIEACETVEGERMLEITVRTEHGVMEIEMENSIPGPMADCDGRFVSRKKEAWLHGFGMESIRAVVEAWQGSYTFREGDGVFFQRITLNEGADGSEQRE